ncbi:MAG: hypothetical protein ACD_41C00253G0001, partial [uncultured bacterium]
MFTTILFVLGMLMARVRRLSHRASYRFGRTNRTLVDSRHDIDSCGVAMVADLHG